ncbi:hypothetical protein [Tuberibacillus sp. Marseille-P3662]|uniref:hypothetical protein n=1 Tax=Tuberibacillus sp. Marseille-P3662 TaxID=1965358 RepID=UPI000A1CCFB8|nr:hypothetical protein [Tuberibacillus sp. Marseille-P3662]
MIVAGVVGGVIIGCAFWERHLLKRDRVEDAQKISSILLVLLIIMGLCGVGYLFINNPLGRFL